ncbi:MAG: hypothetical protein AAGF11_46300 [Myxococcota bacterium]
MALPREKDTYEDYTDQLVYFSARLAANPEVAALAAQVDALIDELDAAFEALRAARRAEVRARAMRDHRDGLGDQSIRRYRRRLRIVSDQHFAVDRIFPKGVGHTVAPRGRPQLDRLEALIATTNAVLESSQLASDPEAEDLRPILEAGRDTATETLAALREQIDQWDAQSLAVARARDEFNFRRADGVGRLGVVIGELRAQLGGNSRAAYAYTQPGRSRSTPPEDVEPESEEVGEADGDGDGSDE